MCYIASSTIQRFFIPQQVRQEYGRDECSHPQAGRTDFRPADRQGKADVTSEKRTASENRRHRRRLLENKKP